MFGFTNEEIVTRGSFWTIWRCPTTVFMQVRGYLDDKRSNEWQQALQHEYDKGYPRFAAMEVTEVDPQTTIQHRFHTAMWIRGTFKIVEQGALLTGGKPGPLVVSRTLLRLIGLDNIALYVDADDFQAHLHAFRAGNKR